LFGKFAWDEHRASFCWQGEQPTAFIKYIIRYFHVLGYFFALYEMGKIGRASKKPSNKVKIDITKTDN
jgi:hypothetical protein